MLNSTQRQWMYLKINYMVFLVKQAWNWGRFTAVSIKIYHLSQYLKIIHKIESCSNAKRLHCHQICVVAEPPPFNAKGPDLLHLPGLNLQPLRGPYAAQGSPQHCCRTHHCGYQRKTSSHFATQVLAFVAPEIAPTGSKQQRIRVGFFFLVTELVSKINLLVFQCEMFKMKED